MFIWATGNGITEARACFSSFKCEVSLVNVPAIHQSCYLVPYDTALNE